MAKCKALTGSVVKGLKAINCTGIDNQAYNNQEKIRKTIPKTLKLTMVKTSKKHSAN